MKSSRSFITENVIINIIVNAAFTYFMGRHMLEGITTIPMWGALSDPFAPFMAIEILVGTFILSAILASLISAITQHKVRSNSVTPVPASKLGKLRRLPENLPKRILYISMLALLSAALPIVLLMFALDIQQVNAVQYKVVHSAYMGLLAGVVTYIAAKRALVPIVRASEPSYV